MFWIYYYLVLIVINIIVSVVCIFFSVRKRNTDYDELDYDKIKKEGGCIIEKIDDFYSKKEKIEGLIKSGSLLYRKAQLSNNLNEKGAKKEIFFLVGSAIVGELISSFIEISKVKEFLANIGIKIPDNGEGLIFLSAIVLVIVVIKLFNTVHNSMEDARSESYRYELSLIEKALSRHIKSSATNAKMVLIEDANGKSSILTLE